MSSRYVTNLVLMLLGSFLVVASQAFGPSTFMWLMLGGAIAALAIAAPAILFTERGVSQRGLDGLTTGLGAWTVVAAAVFAGATITWLGFASGLALVVLAVAGLTAHELRTERVVHSLEVGAPADYRELAGAH